MRHWTSEERQKQALLIQRWKPWNQSTGAVTLEGKSVSKMNAYKHGARCAELRERGRQFTELKRILTQLCGFLN